MKNSRSSLVIATAACAVLALLAVFAIELSNTQAKSKSGIEVQVHERAVLAGALISSLFQNAQQEAPQDSKIYGSAKVSDQMMNGSAQSNGYLDQPNGYLALLDADGRVLAASQGFTAQAQTDLASSAALALIRSGHPYGLGNLLPYGKTGVINFAVVFPTRYGPRTLLTGLTPATVSAFIARELANIPDVKGSHNYLVDGNDVVLATTNPQTRVGSVINQPGAEQALEHPSFDVDGTYFDQVGLTNSTWRIVLTAPDGPLFASVTGLHQSVPWLIFAALAMVALAALGLGRRVMRSADQVRAVNTRLELVNGELTGTNATLQLRAAELARSNEELEHFASIASHDLQEPLRKVRTFTEQLQVTEGDRLSDKGQDYLRRANSSAERMQTLIEGLLRYSRVTTQGRPFAPVDLGQVTREVLVDLDVQVARAGAHVLVGRLPTISADALQIRQLMQNLISNALKFHREGVVPEISIDATVTDAEVRLTVRDNGIGFDPRYSLRIFRVFERLHGRNEYPGTGIGLALCRKIAERHGGSIVANSEPAVSSTFTVILPIDQREEVSLTIRHIDDAAEASKVTHAHA